MFDEKQVKALSAPLNREHVKQRDQSGRKLSYIEGWHAIAEANRIFGYDAWTRETLETRMVAEAARKIGRPPNTRDGWGVSYIARVRVTVGTIVREGIGAGHGIDADLGLAHESAIKEAETDAMKRALMTFGNPFGLALYDKTQAMVGTPANDEDEADDEMSARMADQVIAAIKAASSGSALDTYLAKPDTKRTLQAITEDDYQRVVAAGKAKRASFAPLAAE